MSRIPIERRTGYVTNILQAFIPTWNNERTIKECILALRQTAFDVEITVVDNFSSDATAEIAAAVGAKIVRIKANLGQARTWICQHALGDWFVMVDSDAMACDRWLERMISFRASFGDNKLGAVYCSPVEMPVVDNPKLEKALLLSSKKSEEYYSKARKNEGRFGISLCLVRTEAARDFDTQTPVLEDVLFGWYLKSSGWNYYSLPVWYYHKPLLSNENTLRRARIMGAWMRKIKYTSLPALVFNMFRVFVTAMYGSKTRSVIVYINLIVGWLTHKRYTYDYKWGQG